MVEFAYFKKNISLTSDSYFVTTFVLVGDPYWTLFDFKKSRHNSNLIYAADCSWEVLVLFTSRSVLGFPE